VKILAIVVRYQMPLSESRTVRGLCDALSAQPSLAHGYTVMIWDNSRDAIVEPKLSIPLLYRHSKENLGVSGAYNAAMEYALEHGYPWMLLLDQDSEITADFLCAMLRYGRDLQERSEIAAIAPNISVRGRIISPQRQLFNRRRVYPAGQSGIASGEAFVINSGCLMRAAALHEIGGFSTNFWLDYSDIYVFHQFFLHGKKVWRAADVELEHELAVLDYDRLMMPWRYRSASYAETAFHDLYHGRLENTLQTLILFARAVKQRMKYDNPVFSKITWDQFLYRLCVSRKKRIARWFKEGTALSIETHKR
jgi:GT2 family glycosyltransferase